MKTCRLFALPVLAALLSACGGGGDATVPLRITHEEPTARIDEAGANRATAWSYVSALSLVRVLAIPHIQRRDLSPGLMRATPCEAGAVTVTFNDVDGSRSLSAGDRFDYVYDNCTGFELQNGRIALTVGSVSGGEIADADMNVQNVWLNSLRDFGLSTLVNGVFHIRASGRASWIVTAPGGLDFAVDPGSRAARWTSVNLEMASLGGPVSGGLDLTAAAVGGRTAVDLGQVGYSSQLVTPGAGGPLLTGFVFTRGTGNARTRLTNVGTGPTLLLERDLDGDGGYEGGANIANTALAGAL